MWPGTACAKFTASFTHAPETAVHAEAKTPKLPARQRPVGFHAPTTERSKVSVAHLIPFPELCTTERGEPVLARSARL